MDTTVQELPTLDNPRGTQEEYQEESLISNLAMLDDLNLSQHVVQLILRVSPSKMQSLMRGGISRLVADRDTVDVIFRVILPQLAEYGVSFPDTYRHNKNNAYVVSREKKVAIVRETLLRAVKGKEQFSRVEQFLLQG